MKCRILVNVVVSIWVSHTERVNCRKQNNKYNLCRNKDIHICSFYSKTYLQMHKSKFPSLFKHIMFQEVHWRDITCLQFEKGKTVRLCRLTFNFLYTLSCHPVFKKVAAFWKLLPPFVLPLTPSLNTPLTLNISLSLFCSNLHITKCCCLGNLLVCNYDYLINKKRKTPANHQKGIKVIASWCISCQNIQAISARIISATDLRQHL